MKPAMEDMLKNSRRQIREWKRSISLFGAGLMHLYANGNDISDQHVADIKRYIAENEALIAQYDPEGLTADDNVEFGDVGLLASELYPNRPLAFSIDDVGEAEVLHVFDTEAQALAFAHGKANVKVGHVSQDGWSIAAYES